MVMVMSDGDGEGESDVEVESVERRLGWNRCLSFNEAVLHAHLTPTSTPAHSHYPLTHPHSNKHPIHSLTDRKAGRHRENATEKFDDERS